MQRRNLVYDSRFAVAASPNEEFVNLYLIDSGCVQVGHSPPQQAPTCVVLLDSEYEAASGKHLPLRTWGAPFSGLDFRLRRKQLRLPIGLAAGPQTLSADVTQAVRGLVQSTAPGTSRASAIAAMHRLLVALAAEDAIDPMLNVGVDALSQELSRHATVWRALERLYGRHETSPYLDFISELTGRSLRQLDRDFRALCDTFGLHGNSFRATIRVLRLRRAVLLLSAPSATPKQVAIEVGYGSVEALDRSFRDAGLPAPNTLRAELLTAVPS